MKKVELAAENKKTQEPEQPDIYNMVMSPKNSIRVQARSNSSTQNRRIGVDTIKLDGPRTGNVSATLHAGLKVRPHFNLDVLDL